MQAVPVIVCGAEVEKGSVELLHTNYRQLTGRTTPPFGGFSAFSIELGEYKLMRAEDITVGEVNTLPNPTLWLF
jgi:hypothetical protein